MEPVFKYCTDETAEFMQKGSFQLGTHAKYRRDFELLGAQYGDSAEGRNEVGFRGPIAIEDGSNEQAVIAREMRGIFMSDCYFGDLGNKAAVTIGTVANAFLFCASKAYSKSDHHRWYNREACKYNFCLRLDADRLFSMFEDMLKRKIGDGTVTISEPVYMGSIRDIFAPAEESSSRDPLLNKSSHLSWEKEVRFIYNPRSRLDENATAPIILREPVLATCILDKICLA